MRRKPLTELILEVNNRDEIERTSAAIIYRANKAIKYIQKDDPGLAVKFYRLKSRYVEYYIENQFLINRKEEQDELSHRFNVHGTELIFHLKKTKRLVLENTIDTSVVTEDIKMFIKDLPVMVKILLKLINVLEPKLA